MPAKQELHNVKHIYTISFTVDSRGFTIDMEKSGEEKEWLNIYGRSQGGRACVIGYTSSYYTDWGNARQSVLYPTNNKMLPPVL